MDRESINKLTNQKYTSVNFTLGGRGGKLTI